MNFTPDQIHAADQLHAEATDMINGLVESCREDNARNTGQRLDQAVEVSMIAASIAQLLQDNPEAIAIAALLVGISIHRLAEADA